MNMCPVCGWPLNGERQLKTHLEVKHSDVKYVAVKPFGNQFKMQIHQSYPKGDWLPIGGFLRTSDSQQFVALGQGIYAGEVKADKLSADIAEFLGLGKRVV